MRELPTPEPGDGEVLLKILAVGMNFADLLIAKGTYQVKPRLPFALGMEACGIVEKIGAGVEKFFVGQRVAASAPTALLPNSRATRPPAALRFPIR